MIPIELWFNEMHTDTVKMSIRVNRQLFSERSPYQRIDIFESPEFGRFLTIDGYMMLTERDEFIYHEMITHVPMAINPDIKRVLVVGAGDGGVARELSRYPGIESIEIVEIDEAVVRACREHLPQTACGFDDGRVKIHYEDGMRFIRRFENAFDLIIVDSTDPVGPGESLFTHEFYGSCFKAMTDAGIMVNQHESPFYENDAAAMKKAHRRIKKSFGIAKVYQAHIPTYPSGHWLFGFASKKFHPTRDLSRERWEALGIKTRYYNTNLHVGAFCLPTYVENMLREARA